MSAYNLKMQSKLCNRKVALTTTTRHRLLRETNEACLAYVLELIDNNYTRGKTSFADKNMAKRLGWSCDKVKRCRLRLIKAGWLKIKKYKEVGGQEKTETWQLKLPEEGNLGTESPLTEELMNDPAE